MKKSIVILKLIITLLILAFFATRFDIKALLNVVASMSGLKALIAGSLLCVGQPILAGQRLVHIAKLYHMACKFSNGFRIWLIGMFFSQAMITFVGGDAMRILSLKRLNFSLRAATGVVLLDRVSGFIGLIMVFLIGLPFLLNIIESPILNFNLILLACICFFSVVAFLLLGFLPIKLKEIKRLGFLFELISNSRYFRHSPKDSLLALLNSMILQILNGFIMYTLFYLYGEHINFLWCTAIAAPVLLLAMLPISFAGWGVRESVMLAGFGLLGIADEKILAVSVTFGLSFLFSSLPGIIYFLFEKKNPQLMQTI